MREKIHKNLFSTIFCRNRNVLHCFPYKLHNIVMFREWLVRPAAISLTIVFAIFNWGKSFVSPFAESFRLKMKYILILLPSPCLLFLSFSLFRYNLLAVRYGRVPKRSRELSGSEENPSSIRVSTPSSTPSTPITPTTPQMCSIASPTDVVALATDPSDQPGSTDLTVYDVILCVSQAHRTHCTYTEEIAANLLRKPITLPNDPVLDEECEVSERTSMHHIFFSLLCSIRSIFSHTHTSHHITHPNTLRRAHSFTAILLLLLSQLVTSITDTLKRNKILLWQHYASRITPGVQRVVEFAKRVPGFCDFSQDDQLILIKLGFFEVWLSHVTKLSTDASLTFDDGTYLSRDQLELLYDVSVSASASSPSACQLNVSPSTIPI